MLLTNQVKTVDNSMTELLSTFSDSIEQLISMFSDSVEELISFSLLTHPEVSVLPSESEE
jgi:hypothetical protein